MQCSNHGCGQIMQPYLDPGDGKIYCAVCNKEMANITSIVKNQLKMNKQFKQKSSKPFAVKCKRCDNDDRPIIVNDDVVCARCNKPLDHLSAPFKAMLKKNLNKSSDI